MIGIKPGSETETKIIRAAIYARVSTDEQAERGTIGAQVHALRQTVPHWGMEIVGEYLDDGYSGTLALEKRPGGLRLMDDAKDGKIDVVVFLKTDRLARSLRHLLDIVDFFEEASVTLRCVQEPFNTTNPAGRMMVHMMASFAEMERETILVRTSMGRERIAREGRWTGGIVPYGYHVNDDGHLIPADTPRNGYSFSEAEIVGRIFNWVADGDETARSVARRLNAEGIPSWKKWHRKGMPEPEYRTSKTGLWWPNHVSKMIRSTIYRGEHTFSKTITREVPALVDTATWQRANHKQTSNKRLPREQDKHQYLLRTLITCGACGSAYHGHQQQSARKGKGSVTFLYYRCGAQMSEKQIDSPQLCQAKMIRTDWLDDVVWKDIKAFVTDPGEVLEKLQAKMTETLASTPSTEERRQEIERVLAIKETQRDRMLDAYRRSVIDIEELEEQITRSKAEAEPLYAELMGLVADDVDTGIVIGDLANTEDLLRALRETINGDLDWDTRRSVVDGLVSGITVETSGTGNQKTAAIRVEYNFSEPVHAVDVSTAKRLTCLTRR